MSRRVFFFFLCQKVTSLFQLWAVVFSKACCLINLSYLSGAYRTTTVLFFAALQFHLLWYLISTTTGGERQGDWWEAGQRIPETVSGTSPQAWHHSSATRISNRVGSHHAQVSIASCNSMKHNPLAQDKAKTTTYVSYYSDNPSNRERTPKERERTDRCSYCTDSMKS